jgi:hypothetical protein
MSGDYATLEDFGLKASSSRSGDYVTLEDFGLKASSSSGGKRIM